MRRDEDAEARGRLVRFVPQVFPLFRRGRPRSRSTIGTEPGSVNRPGGSKNRFQSTPFPTRSVRPEGRICALRPGNGGGADACVPLGTAADLHVARAPQSPSFRAPTLTNLAPGRPAAKERPPPDQSGVAADCATRTHENDPGATSRWHPSNEGTGGPSRLVSGTARPIPMLGSSGELGPSLMAAAANRPPGASVLPQDFRRHWSPEQFRLRRPAFRPRYPALRVGASHIPPMPRKRR